MLDHFEGVFDILSIDNPTLVPGGSVALQQFVHY